MTSPQRAYSMISGQTIEALTVALQELVDKWDRRGLWQVEYDTFAGLWRCQSISGEASLSPHWAHERAVVWWCAELGAKRDIEIRLPPV